MPARITTAVNDTRFHGLYFGIPGFATSRRGKGRMPSTSAPASTS
jgi:acetylornithine deacetylase